ncbi:putative bifunctional diguanylate cyclase/phosphodiesterase [Hydrogenophaga atypica]|uniref:Bifunctional diguanylate cyclase/phosphodiesterase n=1 Tax=Hydrogenophaga atypica TaxID=249409 RepID=A0ABW2QM42_9BURK
MNTITRQLLASLLVTVLLVIGSGGYVELRRVVAETELQLRDTQSAAAARLSRTLAYPLWNMDEDEAARLVRSEAQVDAIQAIVVARVDVEGHLAYLRDELGGTMVRSLANGDDLKRRFANNQLVARADVVNRDMLLGVVSVYGNPEVIDSVMRQESLDLLLKLLTYCAVLFVVQFVVLRAVVVLPLRRLTAWVVSWRPEQAAAQMPQMQSKELSALMGSFSDLTGRLLGAIAKAEEQEAQARRSEARISALYGFSRSINELSELVLKVGDVNRLLQDSTRIMAVTLDADLAVMYEVELGDRSTRELALWEKDATVQGRALLGGAALDALAELVVPLVHTQRWQTLRGADLLAQHEGHATRQRELGVFALDSLLLYPIEVSDGVLKLLVLVKPADEAVWSSEEIRFLDDVRKQLHIALSKLRLMLERRRSEDRALYLATRDPLTGLPNRALLTERASYALSFAARSQGTLALLYIDIDDFKDVNDALGHEVGDCLLVELAKRLQGHLREQDLLARSGGDEFVVMLPGVDADGAAHVADKLLQAVTEVCQVRSHELVVTASIGVAMYPADGDDFHTLYRNADAAMYRVKEAGRNGCEFFTHEMQARSARHLRIVTALRQAIEGQQLSVVYQPQMSLKDGSLVGAEALLRWTHPELGFISPAEFIPIAESSGLIVPVGGWVLRKAVRQAVAWRAAGGAPLRMAVNLSAAQFRHADLSAMVGHILQEEGLHPGELELELTEGAVAQKPQQAIDVMNGLRAQGIHLAIDDFGTGYSSMSYLKKFNAHKLKIDQSFVRDISRDADDRAIVTAVIEMAKRLNMTTIAEGVETAEQLAFLQKHGCDQIQGYIYSKPLTPSDFEAFARQPPQLLPAGSPRAHGGLVALKEAA